LDGAMRNGVSLKRSNRQNLLRFLRYLRPHRGKLIAATVAGVLKYNLPVAFPWILKDVVDRLLTGQNSRLGLTFNELMLGALAVFLLYAVATYFRTLLADSLAQRITFDIRNDLFRHLQELPIEFFRTRHTGAIVSRVFTDVSMAQNFIGLAGTNLFMDLTCLLSITVVMFAMEPRLALVAYGTLPLFAVCHRWFRRRLRANAKEVRRRFEILEGRACEAVGGIAEIKSFTAEQEENRRFTTWAQHCLEAALKNIRLNSFALATTAILTRVPSVVVIWVGGHFVLRQQLSVGTLMAFYAYLEMIYNPLSRLSELNIQLANSLAAIDRLFEFLDEKPQAERGVCPALYVREGKIRFQNLVFGYQPGLPVLRGIDAEVQPGQRVAIVGPSGAGKSTLVKLLVRFYEPWGGKILIDGMDIAKVDLWSLRRQIALVQQEPVLFSGTVEDNIRLGRPDATVPEIERAAELANAIEFIRRLPDGFATEIGERGARLSVGQKQRIAIARAFLKDAPVLVLDESTSSLDAPTEELIYEALERLMKNRTTLVIAHRLATVVRADCIWVLNQGQLVQTGAHAELIRDTAGLYHKLYHESLALRETWVKGASIAA